MLLNAAAVGTNDVKYVRSSHLSRASSPETRSKRLSETKPSPIYAMHSAQAVLLPAMKEHSVMHPTAAVPTSWFRVYGVGPVFFVHDALLLSCVQNPPTGRPRSSCKRRFPGLKNLESMPRVNAF